MSSFVFGPGLMVDPDTLAPVVGRTLAALDPDTGQRVPTTTPGPDPVPAPVVTNARGYYGQFAAELPRVILRAGALIEQVTAAGFTAQAQIAQAADGTYYLVSPGTGTHAVAANANGDGTFYVTTV